MNDSKNEAESVCVIGAGVSGTVVVKELKQARVSVEAFEMMPIVGGVFGSYSWKDGLLTSSSIFTWYSDFPISNRQSFLTWEEFLKYLESYVDHFGIRDAINLNCKVISAQQNISWLDRTNSKEKLEQRPFFPPETRSRGIRI